MEYKTLITKINVYSEGDNPIYGESVTEIELQDEAGGAFVTITQHPNYNVEGSQLRFNFEEIPLIMSMIEMLKNQEGLETNDSN